MGKIINEYMILNDIIADSGVVSVTGDRYIEISDICNDSRKAAPGSLFIAVKGHDADGQTYIASAIKAGAVAVAYEDEDILAEQIAKAGGGAGIALVKVENSRHAVAIMAANFYDNPSRKLTLIGITGTNGKTTTVTLLYNLFMSLGYNCGLLSTIANFVGKHRSETENTTADPITINHLMNEMVNEGCEYCFMEVSSIGLEQERVSGLEFKVAIFSNLTHDHLDYHKTFAEYLRCKKLFFDNLGPNAVAITNVDDKNGMVMVQNTKARVVTYSCKGMADHTCRIMEESMEGMLLRIDGREAWTKLIGQHNAYNILAIYCAALAVGANPDETLVKISGLGPATGRLENRKGPNDITAVIDYAHTPDALENVLKTLKDIDKGRTLICLFGCGGDRDKTKRPEMAKIAEEFADRIIVTSDNSRTEKTEDIMNDIKAGFSPKGLAKAIFIADRKEAIRTAVMTAPKGAVILLAGKGHETYQIIGSEHRHFDEREVLDEVFSQINTENK
ncbi:MAG: UDP-N-acetylmuramoyl-L-alanyl-D-glutamate--2,6-diaminopimelate ligase [Bacteroidales bacterium]|nr:UDP-N-acetylmuramoyl-L-alanyl-D-glutamate--2,6-diaminopimelate ligase [Bacteroidales bacterium]MDD7088126.1 UDP-N-acetylmuramoyl-L-alanyl-D-glutamate--2,6-diaminopimelate ligase [Bacteroidales bacterium]MDY2936126.1 UDP-N-acetylmuramoyl-L-alanyl-D-glutamate--2,6-diaminopimelate ligase [Candidatus Cryptobacteroides sp.]